MSGELPLVSREVRWFLDGGINHHRSLKRWFEDKTARDPACLWAEQRSDIYLLVPESADMGIKWREGKLQIKGRVAACGTTVFGARHQGLVERWIKWSYEEVAEAYRSLFQAEEVGGLRRVSVRKIRALRKMRLDPFTGSACEIAPDAAIDRGLNVELVDLEVNGMTYCSLAYEGFPCDPAMATAFAEAVSLELVSLTEPRLHSTLSRSYPGWLAGLFPSR